jgi:hypothetical protein
MWGLRSAVAKPEFAGSVASAQAMNHLSNEICTPRSSEFEGSLTSSRHRKANRPCPRSRRTYLLLLSGAASALSVSHVGGGQ